MTVTRREFVASLASTGLILQVRLPSVQGVHAAGFQPSAYLRIAPDGAVTIWATKLEMGQGVRTLLPMILADELEADWSHVRVEQAWTGEQFKGIRLHTSGSSSAADSWRALRTAGAAAREMLVQAAADTWGVKADSCRASLGVVRHIPTGRTLSYGKLVERAAALPVPEKPALKDAQQFRLVGRPTRKVDSPDIVTGRARYGLDLKLPGMLYASIVRAPTLGGTLVSFDAKEALAVPGVRDVRPVTAGVHAGVAVLADDTWSAMRGRAALKVEWAPGAAASFDSQAFLDGMPKALAGKQYKVRHDGDARAALDRSARRLTADYMFPFQAHAPLETQNCTADVRADRAEVWVPTQTDVRSLAQAARVTGLEESRITIHPTLMGGAFGRRLFADFVAEAVELSKLTGKAVQVLLTREDDMRHGYFQPATLQRFTAGLDGAGKLTALVHVTTASDLTIYDIHGGRNIWTGPAKEPRAENAFEEDEIPWGAFDNPYALPALRVDCADVTSPVPVGPWRAVMYPATVFGRESFLDEIAAELGIDPIAFRLSLLPAGVTQAGGQAIDRGRLAHVLEMARDRSGWSRPLAHTSSRWRGRGVAANVYHARSFFAMVAEVSVARDLSDLRVERIVMAVDCGFPLNPLGITGQAESGVTWGLSATLLGKMNFVGGAAQERGFGDFRILTIDQMPVVETHIVPSREAPAGFGEHPVPTVAPAGANAVFNATGRRLRELPLTPARLALTEGRAATPPPA